MKKFFGSIFLIVFVVIFSTVLFTLPAPFDWLNLSKYDKLGSAIGGLTAPVLGLLSAILLYLALMEQLKVTRQQGEVLKLQMDANRSQKEQMQIDLLYNLMMQAEKHIEQFFFSFERSRTTSVGNEKSVMVENFRLAGLEAIHRWCNHMKGLGGSNTTLSRFFQSSLLILIIRTLLNLELEIEKSRVPEPVKQQFAERVKLLELVIKDPLKELIKALDNKRLEEDHISAEIRVFMSK